MRCRRCWHAVAVAAAVCGGGGGGGVRWRRVCVVVRVCDAHMAILLIIYRRSSSTKEGAHTVSNNPIPSTTSKTGVSIRLLIASCFSD